LESGAIESSPLARSAKASVIATLTAKLKLLGEPPHTL
jgi:hypothetical protein